MTLPAVRHQDSMSRVVLCSCDRSTGNALLETLASPDLELFCCHAVDSVIEEVIRRRPEVVVYEIRARCQADLAVLQLLKRVAPDVPFVLITSEGSLHLERLVRELRPVYYAVQPVDPDEIVAAVHAALARRPAAARESHAGLAGDPRRA